jgi:hypothetical protein
MRRKLPVYGLDIETDTSENGLDPSVAPVLTVALASEGYEETFTGPEPELLVDLDDRLARLEPGVIATWNGGAFDLPFLADRAALYGMRLGLTLQPDAALSVHSALPGHAGAYRASWYHHSHLDAYRVYGNEVGASPRFGSLRSIGRFVGLSPADDGAPVQDLSNEALHAYAASDARLARILAERRWTTAMRCIDKVEQSEPRRAERPAHLQVIRATA